MSTESPQYLCQWKVLSRIVRQTCVFVCLFVCVCGCIPYSTRVWVVLITLKGSPARPSVSPVLCPQVTHTDACKLFGQELDGEIMSNECTPVAHTKTKHSTCTGTNHFVLTVNSYRVMWSPCLWKKKKIAYHPNIFNSCGACNVEGSQSED